MSTAPVDTELRLARAALGYTRGQLSARLCADLSFTSVEAMGRMAAVTEAYVRALQLTGDGQAVWLAGSLGRREMLPNSDLDLFVIVADDQEATSTLTRVPKDGFDMFELGLMSLAHLRALLGTRSIDANTFIDGRPLDTGPTSEAVGALVRSANSNDRQVANFISEYGYYHYFDFIWKRTSHGANLKYSSGSARVTLFFNFYCRLVNGEFPASRGVRPEFLDGLDAAEHRLGQLMPRREIDLIQVVKNTAMSAYYRTHDPRLRHVSQYSLDVIFEVCSPRMRDLGLRDAAELRHAYGRARRRVETAVADLARDVVVRHPLADLIADMWSRPPEDTVRCCGQLAAANPDHQASVLAAAAWSCVLRGAGPEAVAALTEVAFEAGLPAAWGAVMAVVCAPTATLSVLLNVLRWLDWHERGAYLTKLLSRNPMAPVGLRQQALDSYWRRESVRQFGSNGVALSVSTPT